MRTYIYILQFNWRDMDRVYNYVHLHSGLRTYLSIDTDGRLVTSGNAEKVMQALWDCGYKSLIQRTIK